MSSESAETETKADAVDEPADVESTRMRGFAQRWTLLGILGLMVVVFSFWKPDEFAQWSNFESIINGQMPMLFVALACVVVLIVGEFDLSLGAILGLCQYVVLWVVVEHGVTWPIAILIALAIGALLGLINAILVKGIGINSFIATIGMSSIILGLISWVSDNHTPIFTGAPEGFTKLGQTEFLSGLTLPVIYGLVACVLLWVLLERTVFGREMRATGANRTAAILSGLRTDKAVYVAFVLAGILAAIGGIIATSRIGAADANSGPSYLLPAYAAAFLGATAVKPGFENVWGTVIAIFVVAVGVVGLQLAGANAWVTDVFNGMVLLVAVSASMISGSLSRRGGLRGLFVRGRDSSDSGPAAAGPGPDPGG